MHAQSDLELIAFILVLYVKLSVIQVGCRGPIHVQHSSDVQRMLNAAHIVMDGSALIDKALSYQTFLGHSSNIQQDL